MKILKLGKVLHVSNSGNLIVQGESGGSLPRLNSRVFTRKMEEVGRIKEVFGPVNRPYYSIRPLKKISIPGVQDKIVYFGNQERRRRE